MQAFYAMKTPRKVIKETLRIKKLGVTDIISNSIVIKLLSEVPENFEEFKLISELP